MSVSKICVDARGGHALDHEGIERVEGAERGEARLAAAGRRRVHVVEVAKVRAVLEVAEDRQPVARDRRVRGGRPRAGGGGEPRRDGDTEAGARHSPQEVAPAHGRHSTVAAAAKTGLVSARGIC